MTHEIIYTDRLMLRAFEREDTDALFEILSDEKSNRFLPWFMAKTTEDAQRFFETRCKAVYENSDGLCYAICQKDLGKPIGYVTVKGTAPFDLGYGLASRYWNNGYATEACKAVIRKCGSDGMDYLTATHDVLNPASGRVMQKCGMRYIHSYREHWMPKDIDVVFRLYQYDLKSGVPVCGYYRKDELSPFTEESDDIRRRRD